ncbi:MAG: hypothetical protein GC191_20520 [Azospirillum sp.]|nr:hypothetical protein [Azospirillum sp.]
MPKLVDLISVLAAVLGVPEKTVAVYARYIREAKLLTTSGRGPGGAEMKIGDCVNILMAILGSDAVKDAVSATRLYSNLILDEAIAISHEEEGQKSGWKVNPPGLRFLNRVGVRFPLSLYEMIERAKDGRLQNALLELDRPEIKIEVFLPIPHAMISVSCTHNNEFTQTFFGNFLNNPTSSDVINKEIDYRNEHCDFRTSHVISHRTIIALGEMLREE